MDLFEDYLPTFFNLYTTYYAPYEPYIRPYKRYIFVAQSYAYKYIFPTLWPLYRLTSFFLSRLLSDTPDLATLAVLAIVLFLSLKVLDILRRQIMYWMSLALRLLLWASVGLIGFYVYQRGGEQSLEDLGWILGFFAGLEDEGERIGKTKGRQKMGDAKRAASAGQRRRTRGGGWN
ncbi:hypothetical protein MMC13_004574 [Lambiella insularis]|nr:hypothetical protein [Lambiella insularis]